MAGSLPAPGLLHLRQFSLLGRITRLGAGNILFKHGWNVLTATSPCNHSWFCEMRELSQQYSLPDPLTILASPPLKQQFKSSVKLKILEWWQEKFREEANLLPSLVYFKPNFMSLARPHPIWMSSGCSPYEVKKATVQARMLSGKEVLVW